MRSEIEILKRDRPTGWEALVAHKEREASNPINFSYFGQIYLPEQEALFPAQEQSEIIKHADTVFASLRQNAATSGLLVRLCRADGTLVENFAEELFPRWVKGSEYQSAESLFSWFYKAHGEALLAEPGLKLSLTPVVRYPSGPAFKNYYFLNKPDDSIRKIRRHFLVNDRPSVTEVAFTFHRKESGDLYMNKFYPTGDGARSTQYLGYDEPNTPEDSAHSMSVPYLLTGAQPAIQDVYPSWYRILPPIKAAGHDEESPVVEAPAEIDEPVETTHTPVEDIPAVSALTPRPDDDIESPFAGFDEEEAAEGEVEIDLSDEANEPKDHSENIEAVAGETSDDDDDSDYLITDISNEGQDSKSLDQAQAEPASAEDIEGGGSESAADAPAHGDQSEPQEPEVAQAEDEPSPEPASGSLADMLRRRGLL